MPRKAHRPRYGPRRNRSRAQLSRRSRQRRLRRPARMCGPCYDVRLCYFRADPAALRSFAAFALAVRPIEPSCLSLAKDAKRPMKCCRWTWHANRAQRGLDRIATGGASRECEEARAAPDIAKLAAFGRYCGRIWNRAPSNCRPSPCRRSIPSQLRFATFGEG